LILVIWIFLGFVISFGFILLKQPIKNFLIEIKPKKEDL
jgi:LPS O-antigen subunit length determinant protein (WzzB/FepE family)